MPLSLGLLSTSESLPRIAPSQKRSRPENCSILSRRDYNGLSRVEVWMK
jgi:hypothetical protein